MNHSLDAPVALPLPQIPGGVVRLLVSRPEELAVAVQPLAEFDEPHGVAQAYLAFLCDVDGVPQRPVEVWLNRDIAGVTPATMIPHDATVTAIRTLPSLREVFDESSDGDEVSIVGSPRQAGPLLLCRKFAVVFAARSGEGGALLSRPDLAGTLDEFVEAQRRFVRSAAAEAAAGHPCVSCGDRERCYPAGDEYAFAADRLTPIHACDGPLLVSRWGEWSWADGCRLLAGESPMAVGESAPPTGAAALDDWRRAAAERMSQRAAPQRLAGEADGRDLLEIARLKLALIADVFEQLHALWMLGGRPHLCWNDRTLRASAAVERGEWRLKGVLRKCGVHPLSSAESADAAALPYPPAYSDESYLPPDARQALRHFDQPRRGGLFIKAIQPEGQRARVTALLEDSGLEFDWLRVEDTVRVSAGNWRGSLSPAATRETGDGEGVPLTGLLVGDVSELKRNQATPGVEVRWLPRFHEAVDLHALGLLAAEMLVATDELAGEALREGVRRCGDSLAESCAALEPAQRDAHATGWIAGEAAGDGGGALWSRRNVRHAREARRVAKLDGFPIAIWQAVVGWLLRMTTQIDGFSYCGSRAERVLRIGGSAAPLVELRGLIALADDVLLSRAAPAAAVRRALTGGR